MLDKRFSRLGIDYALQIAAYRRRERHGDYRCGNGPEVLPYRLDSAERINEHARISRHVYRLVAYYRVYRKAYELRVEHIRTGDRERSDDAAEEEKLRAAHELVKQSAVPLFFRSFCPVLFFHNAPIFFI